MTVSSTAHSLESFVFASGPKGGTYEKVIKVLAREVRSDCADCRISVVPSQGSYDNVSLIRTRAAHVALVQSDVGYLEFFENRSFKAIASLYTEPIHAVARKELGLKLLSELSTTDGPFKVAVGPKGSGTTSNALMLLDQLQAPPGHIDKYRYGLEESLEKLNAREIDIFFLTAAPPVRPLLEAASRDMVTFLAIDSDIVQGLLRKYPFLSPAEIPYEAYGVRGRNVPTLGPRTLLVVRNDASPDLVETLLDSLYRVASQAEEYGLPALAGLIPEEGLDDIPIPVHPRAISYHEAKASIFVVALELVRTYALPVMVLLAPLLVLFRLSKVAYFIHQYVLGRVLILLVTVWLTGAAAMYLIEGSKNSSFRSFEQSAIAILHYLLSGLESKYPITAAGNVVAVIILTLGAVLVALFTASLVTILVERVFNVRKLNPKPWVKLKLKGHVILVGWSRRVENILAHLRSPDLLRRPAVVVVAPDREQVHLRNEKTYRNTWFVEGEVAKSETLTRADIETADSVLLLSSNTEAEGDDSVSVSTSLAIKSMASRARVVAEVHDKGTVQHLHQRVEEIISVPALGGRILSQCVITPGISEVFNELLTFQRDSQEIYAIELPSFLEGASFRQVQRELLQYSVIPLGYQRDENGRKKYILNPKEEEGASEGSLYRRNPLLCACDRLVVIADRPRLDRAWLRQLEDRVSTGSRNVEEKDMGTTSEGTARQSLRVGICGWNDEARAVIKQLRASVIASHHDFLITVICDPARESINETNGAYHEKITFVIGDPSKRRVLENAGIETFDNLVVLGDRDDGEGPAHDDNRSLMIALAAHDLCPDLHTVVKVHDPENREHFERLSNVEIVSTREISEKLLAQAAISPGITEVFMELLTATEVSNEVYIVPVPPRWVGWSFQSIYSAIVESAEPVLPIGYRVWHDGNRRPTVVLNPSRKKKKKEGVDNWRSHKLRRTDHLVVIAYEEPCWDG